MEYDRLWAEGWGDLQRYGPASRHQRRVLAALLDRLAFASVLDVGCGEGSTLAFLGDRYRCRELVGLDLSEEALRRARVLCPRATFRLGPASRLRGEVCCDLVTCVDVLEHVEDDVGLLRDLAAVARRHVLCVTVQGRMRPGEREIGHVRNYGRGELLAKMAEADLRPVRTVEWGFPFYSPLFRSLVAGAGAEGMSLGRYGPGRRLLCRLLYGLFLANSWSRGDKLFVLAEVPQGGP